MNKHVLINNEACTGCHLCELACSTYHFGTPSLSLSRIIIYKDKAYPTFTPAVCISCPNMPCAKVCPTNAIIKDTTTNMPKVILEECISCGECVKACPYKAINFDTSAYKYPLICDLCGGDPQCVKVCPTNALKIVELTEENDLDRFKLGVESLSKIKAILNRYGEGD